MKKQLLFILVAMLMSGGSYAQTTFAPVGAEWWYGGDCEHYDNWCEGGDNKSRCQALGRSDAVG